MTSARRFRAPRAGGEESFLTHPRLRLAALVAGALGLSALAVPAAAQDNEVFQLTTTVPQFCQAMPTGGTPSVDVGSLSGPNGFLVTAFSGTTSYQVSASYYCNAPATVTLSATPLEVTPSVTVTADQQDSFTNRVDYTAGVTWNTLTGSTTSSAASPTVVTTTQPNTGELKIQISNPTVAGNRRPLAGAYSGAVTVTVALS